MYYHKVNQLKSTDCHWSIPQNVPIENKTFTHAMCPRTHVLLKLVGGIELTSGRVPIMNRHWDCLSTMKKIGWWRGCRARLLRLLPARTVTWASWHESQRWCGWRTNYKRFQRAKVKKLQARSCDRVLISRTSSRNSLSSSGKAFSSAAIAPDLLDWTVTRSKHWRWKAADGGLRWLYQRQPLTQSRHGREGRFSCNNCQKWLSSDDQFEIRASR